jgi:hypothetical protein
MSIFDPPRPFLNPNIFDSNKQVHSDVREYIFSLLAQFYPFEKIYRAVLLGSMTTHQYTDESDIDINVMGISGEEYDAWHEFFKQSNNKNYYLPGTRNPIHFFFQIYVPPDRVASWKNSLGAYDLLNNVWLKEPMPYEKIGDPKDRYAKEIAYVNMMTDMIASEVNAVRQALQLGDKERALHSLKVLQRFFKKVEDQRKEAFEYGAGSPSVSEDNLIYKLIEHGPYGQLFKDLL